MPTANDRLIGPVPAQIINLARPLVTAYDGRVAEFNIAAWLQLSGLERLPVSLMIRYLDGEQRREVAVDHGNVGAHGKVLLSGIARLTVKQKIQQAEVFLRSAVPAQSLLVEELFVQAVEQVNSDKRQALV
ncbi:MAG: hypothetical protein Q8R10_00715 [Pseudomonas sp.]|uniref:hypothetical protein n=1 Tax=Pseudomonas sp. TaxID=306 RepID=UPI002733F6DF|nr:hypothetical protein [Pseudomonas sp.]MDP3844940.1 hypothetical protein [Pseudomonas sp.]